MPDSAPAGLHGRRLTMREYEAGIVALHERGTLSDEQIRRCELDLAVDLRLGVDFPRERRELLWQMQQRVGSRPWDLVGSWVAGLLSRRWLERRGARAAQRLVQIYATVLDPQELRDFLGEEMVE